MSCYGSLASTAAYLPLFFRGMNVVCEGFWLSWINPHRYIEWLWWPCLPVLMLIVFTSSPCSTLLPVALKLLLLSQPALDWLLQPCWLNALLKLLHWSWIMYTCTHTHWMAVKWCAIHTHTEWLLNDVLYTQPHTDYQSTGGWLYLNWGRLAHRMLSNVVSMSYPPLSSLCTKERF
jgi:hypothetical protein